MNSIIKNYGRKAKKASQLFPVTPLDIEKGILLSDDSKDIKSNSKKRKITSFSDFKDIDDLLKRAIVEQVASTTKGISSATDFPKHKEEIKPKPGEFHLIDEPKIMTTPSKMEKPDNKVRSGM